MRLNERSTFDLMSECLKYFREVPQALYELEETGSRSKLTALACCAKKFQ
jgi:hypothetical protein